MFSFVIDDVSGSFLSLLKSHRFTPASFIFFLLSSDARSNCHLLQRWRGASLLLTLHVKHGCLSMAWNTH